MLFAPPLLRRALDQARTDWLSGDPAAWGRYAACLAHLERAGESPVDRPRPTAPRLRRLRQRPPRGRR
ncbi:MAG: hypothetical protein R3181_02200 [Rubricoccaceae bacterium]|nr:hypothetical protein [Rubricoccaceae bacterium]